MDTNQNGKMDNDLENTYHAPKEGQPAKYEQLRATGKTLAYMIKNLVPNSREQSLALTKLEEVIFWANAGIARTNNPQAEPAVSPIKGGEWL